MDPLSQSMVGLVGFSTAIGLAALTYQAAKQCKGEAFSTVVIYLVGLTGSLAVFGCTLVGIFKQ